MKILAKRKKFPFRAMLLSDVGIVEHLRPHHHFPCPKISTYGLLEHLKVDFNAFLNAVTKLIASLCKTKEHFTKRNAFFFSTLMN